MTPGFRDTEERPIDLEPDHRSDEVGVLLVRLLVDLHVIGFQQLTELGHHRVVDDEVGPDGFPAGRSLPDARVAFRVEPRREIRELITSVQRAAEASGIEPFEWTWNTPVRFDASTAVDGTPRVSAFQV